MPRIPFRPWFRPLRLGLFALAALGLGMAASAATWTVSVDPKEGLPVMHKGGAPATSPYMGFWRANWAWADLPIKFTINAPFDYSVSGRNAALNFDLAGSIRKVSDNQLRWEYDLVSPSERTTDVIGGGEIFRFDLGNFGSEMGDPELLPNNAGWAWGRPEAARVEMRFEPALPALYYERNYKGEVRAFFYSNRIPAGRTRYTATMTLAGDVAISPTYNERFGPVDTANWPRSILDWKTSPVDLSFLNQPEIPAGKHGLLRAVGDRLVFEDGTPARFWGTNLSAYTLFTTPKDAVKAQARRLSELGFNLVRLHHHDSYWVDPNIFGSASVTNTRSLSDTSLEKLDWWIRCLRDEGIYVWLDLHVQRYLKPGDNITDFAELAKGQPSADLRGFNYLNASVRQAMKNTQAAYLNRFNIYTNRRYRDDRAIIGLLVTNENDFTHHFGNAFLPDKNVPKHNAIYMSMADQFAATWGLPKDKVWRSWEHGPAKIFLNDVEYRFNREMIDHLRGIDARAPVATTSSWGLMPLSSLPALTYGSMIDVHSYGGIGEIDRNPLYGANFMHWIAAAQVPGKPLTVSEWNVENFPAPDRHSAPLYMAASAALQGWDAMMQYAYAQIALDYAGNASNWHAFTDPSMIATLPAGALLYRQGHVAEATTHYVFAPGAALFNQLISPANSVALRTAAERGKLLIAMPATTALPWLRASTIPAGARVFTNPAESLIPGGTTAVTSDNGQIRRDWGQGVYMVNTPRSQIAAGWLGGKNIQLPDVGIAVTIPNASVAVQSMDGLGIASSRRLLISLGARSLTIGGNKLPYYSEPVLGQITIRAPSGLKLYKRRVGTNIEDPLPFTYSNGRYVINLTPALATYWMFLK